MSSVRPSNSGCYFRALPTIRVHPDIGWTHARHCPFLKYKHGNVNDPQFILFIRKSSREQTPENSVFFS